MLVVLKDKGLPSTGIESWYKDHFNTLNKYDEYCDLQAKLADWSKFSSDDINVLSKSGVEISEKAGKQLEDVVPEMEKTLKLVQEISAASQEQNSGADQINSAIQQLNQVTQQNAAGSEELASSSEELASQAETIAAACSQLCAA